VNLKACIIMKDVCEHLAAERVTRGTLYIALQNAATFILGLVFYIFAARLLTKVDIGLISVLMFVMTLFTSVSQLSIPDASVKYISEHIGRGESDKAASVAATTWHMMLIGSLLMLAVTCTLSVLLVEVGWRGFPLPALIVVLFAAFLINFQGTYTAFLQGLQMFGRLACVYIIYGLISCVAGVGLVALGYGLSGVALAYLLGASVSVVVAAWFYYGKLPRTPASYSRKTLIKYGYPLFLASMIFVASTWVDRICYLASTSNLAGLAVLDLAVRGSNVLLVIYSAVGTVIFPAMAELYGRLGKKGVITAVQMSSRYLAYLIFPLAIGLAILARTAMALLFGWQYTVGALAFSILVLAGIMTAFGTLGASALQALGKTRVFIKIGAVSILVDIILIFMLVPFLGVVGAAVSRAAMLTVSFVYILYALKKEITVVLDMSAIKKAVFASIIMAIPLGLFEHFVAPSMHPLDSAVLEILIGTATLIPALLAFHALTSEDYDVLRQITPTPLHPMIDFLQKYAPK
jgi:O-antigen/teichoic acid export membrane protein